MQDEFPKCPICGSTNGYESSGILGKYAKCRVCMAKWKVFAKHKQISRLILHELPKDGSSVYTITSTKAPLFTVIGTRLPTDFWKDLELKRKINWEFLAMNINPDVTQAVIASQGEKLLHQWEGTREVREEKVVSGHSVRTMKLQPGALLLSTQRLHWLEKRVRGFWKKVTSFLVMYEIPLEEIRGISGESGDSDDWHERLSLNKISVVDSKGENAFNLQHVFLEVFKPMVENAIELRRKEIDAEKKKERLHVMLDFSFLETYMKKGGLVMQVLKCPECGGSIEFPKSGSQTKCPYCGKTIYAQDIFEKVKSLLE